MSETIARTYGIAEISEKLKLPDTTVRYYEQQFAEFLEVRRSSGNRRLFTESDLRLLTEVVRLKRKERMSLGSIRDYLRSRTVVAVAGVDPEEPREVVRPKPEQPPTMVAAEQIAPQETVVLADTGNLATKQDIAQLREEIDKCLKVQLATTEVLKRIGRINSEVKQLLDMNLLRYNELSKKLQNN